LILFEIMKITQKLFRINKVLNLAKSKPYQRKNLRNKKMRL
jgi:hypothetical protein